MPKTLIKVSYKHKTLVYRLSQLRLENQLSSETLINLMN